MLTLRRRQSGLLGRVVRTETPQAGMHASLSASSLGSGASGAWPQPSHDDLVRSSAAAWQEVSLDRRFGEGQCLLAGLSFLARERHPFTNDGASYFRFVHVGVPFE